VSWHITKEERKAERQYSDKIEPENIIKDFQSFISYPCSPPTTAMFFILNCAAPLCLDQIGRNLRLKQTSNGSCDQYKVWHEGDSGVGNIRA